MKNLRRMPVRFRDDDCPAEVADIFDEGNDKALDRYTIVYATVNAPEDAYRRSVVYLGASADPTQGFGQHGEFRVHEMSQFRDANRRKRVKWSSLPDTLRDFVKRSCVT